MKRHLLGLLTLFSIRFLAGCGSAGSTSPPPMATRLTVTAASSTVSTGTALSITVKAIDASGGVASSYAGTVNFTSSDPQALLPGVTAMSGGTASVQVTFESAGTQTVTASDVTNALATGTSAGISVNGTLSITSGNPPDGVAGSDYNPQSCCDGFRLNAAGGVPPYTWSWTGQPGSSTPPGLDIESSGSCPSDRGFSDWRIVCVPTTAGIYKVVITVVDSASPPKQVSANYNITIVNPPPPVISMTPPPSEGAFNLPYRFNFTATYGLKPLTWSETGALPPGLGLTSDGTLSGTPTATGSFPVTVMVVDSVGQSATPQDFKIGVALHGFKVTGSMPDGRKLHTATLLPDGKVFVAGGVIFESGGDGGTYVTGSTLTYDPDARTFSGTGVAMQFYREKHTATLLNTGKVLITGGWNGAAYRDTAEIFDPVSNAFAPTTGKMTIARGGHQATLLNDGKVLITGGWTDGNPPLPLLSAEIYDPGTGMFTRTAGDMHIERTLHTQTTLKDGTVLVAGGVDNSSKSIGTAEVYDPKSGSFSTPINMTTPRAAHAATLLDSGKVLLSGGFISGTGVLASAEIFDPSSDTFAATTGNMATARRNHTATLLSDGTVLVFGYADDTLALAELFDPTSETFSGTGNSVTQRSFHTATLLNDGSVLVVGGESRKPVVGPTQYTILSSAETYQ